MGAGFLCWRMGRTAENITAGNPMGTSKSREMQIPSIFRMGRRWSGKKNRRKPKRMGGEAGFGFRRSSFPGGVLSAVSLGGEEARGNRNNLSLFRPFRYSVNACADSWRAMASGIVTPAFTSLAYMGEWNSGHDQFRPPHPMPGQRTGVSASGAARARRSMHGETTARRSHTKRSMR